MRVINLLLCILSLTTAKIQPRTGVNDVFDGVEGVMYDIPEYEDPEVSLFQLIAKGIMPVVVKGVSDLPNKDDKPHYQTDDIKKGLDTVITQLQEAKNKLENGNNAVYLDIDKSVLSLENLKHHLYLDLHPTVAYSKPSAAPEIIVKGFSDKAPSDQYSVIKTSIKKYLSSDYPMNKYFSFDIPSIKSLSSYKFHHSSLDDTALMPHLSSKAPIQLSSVDGFYSKKQSFESSSKDETLASSSMQPLSSSSMQPLSSSSMQPLSSSSIEPLSSSSMQPLSSSSMPPLPSSSMQPLSSSSMQPLSSSSMPPLPSSSVQPLSSVSEDPFYLGDTSSSESIFAVGQNLPASSERPLPSESLDSSYPDDTSASEHSFSENSNLSASSEQSLKHKASTEHPTVIDESVYEFKLLSSAVPPVKVIPRAKEMEIDVLDDVSSAKTDQAEKEDKSLIRKKWSWKIPTTGSLKE